MCYEDLARFLKSADQALIIQRLHYWLQIEEVGYHMGDGCKWIYNGYKEWLEQFTWLSVDQFGRHIRYLEEIGWIVTARFYELQRDVGFVDKAPLLHPYNQRKWYRLNYQKIFEDTGIDLLFKKYGEGKNNPPNSSKPAPLPNLQESTLRYKSQENPIGKIADSSIYKEYPNSLYQKEAVEREKEEIIFNQENTLDPWAEELIEEPIPDPHEMPLPNNEVVEQVNNEILTSNVEPHEGQCSAAPGQGFEKRFKPEPKRNSEGIEKEIWEIAASRPYPVFLNWWADKKYKPQGGKWEADAIGNAYSEFYNKRDRTTVAIFPQFLEYMQQVAENCNQQLAAGIKAILPSCFVAKPDASHGNVEQLMQNISELVDRGVQVALPTNSATPSSTQSMNFARAAGSNIAALGKLEAVVPEQITPVVESDFLQIFARKQMMWNTAPALRDSIRKWAELTPGVEITEDRLVLTPLPSARRITL